MAQFCQMCGEAEIADDHERCPRCQQSLLVSEGLPPRAKPQPPRPPVPSPKVEETPRQTPVPAQEKRPRRPRPSPAPPAPAPPPPAPAPQLGFQPPNPESSEFGRWVERFIDDGVNHDRQASPSREKPLPEVDIPDSGPPLPPRRRVAASGLYPGPAQLPSPPEQKGLEPVTPGLDRLGPRQEPRPQPFIPIVARDQGHAFAPESHGIEMTEGPRGIDIGKLNIPTRSYEVELFSASNQWAPLFQLIGMDKSPVFGRSSNMLDQGMETMAARHVRFKNTMAGVEIEPLESLNGIYVQVSRPTVLADGMRFRIGDYVLEYRDAEPDDPATPKVGDDGERFVAHALEPLGFLDFIRPDDRPGVRFPILKPTSTVLGRGGIDPSGVPRQVDVPLLNDKLVSGRHAEIRRVDDHFVIEDLKSKNGTFVQVREKTVVRDGATICLGKLYLRVTRIKTLEPR